ncbi:MAG TPA: hypothetical protein EYQ60_05870 [Myxococcales bacterium]|nr:hypothetical protein [Myxococcales bacterium]HIK85453.1 hypothetical protein [Myxococcales bacterium]
MIMLFKKTGFYSQAVLQVALVLFAALPSESAEMPPINPFLADSVYPLGHGASAQQGALPVAGPTDPGPRFAPSDVHYAATGPAQFGAYTSGPYPDGRRVYWSNGLDRIVKVDFETFENLATHWVPGAKRWTEAEAEESIAEFDDSNQGFFSLLHAFRDASKLRDLSSVYTVLDSDNTYFIGDKSGRITAYGDSDPNDPASEIVEKGRFQMPEFVTGLSVGMNMTFDGWLIVPTEHGYVVAISKDLKQHRVIRMRHSEGAEDKATRPTGYGWVRNGTAIDSDGGIYVASQEHMHKLIWTGDQLSIDSADGAWTARYLNGWGNGTGATPSLMGFADEDRFVVITDGEDLMNVVLFWRDAIPADWKGLPGSPDRRIAGMLPADMGDEDLKEIQSEQSVVVAGYGALVVNNVPRNVPWYLPSRARSLLISYLGSSPRYQPYGVQKFEWDASKREFRVAWVNREVSSPSCVPIASYPSGRVYLIGARENRWTLEAIDWSDGQSAFHAEIGGQRYNPLFSGTIIDERGRIHYGSPWGRVRLAPGD